MHSRRQTDPHSGPIKCKNKKQNVAVHILIVNDPGNYLPDLKVDRETPLGHKSAVTWM